MNTATKPALPPLPEIESEADIEYLKGTPESWDADYRSIWTKLQVESRNKSQWRKHALELRALFQTCEEHGYQRGLAEARAAFKPAYYSVTWNGEHCSNLWRLKADAEAACKRLNDKHPDAVRAIETLYELAAHPTEQAAPAEPWQPIETAPRDGTRILIGRPEDESQDHNAISTLGWWIEALDDGVDYMGNDAGFTDHEFNEFGPGRSFGNPSHRHAGTQPTHWMPLPAAQNSAHPMQSAKPDAIADMLKGVPSLWPQPQDGVTIEVVLVQEAQAVKADALGFAVMEHLGPAALTGGKMSPMEAFEKGWHAALASLQPVREPLTKIYILEKLWTDSMENEISAASGYTPIGFVLSEQEAIDVIDKAGSDKGECWAVKPGTPKLKSIVLPLFGAAKDGAP